MRLTTYMAGQRLLRLRQRARVSATRDGPREFNDADPLSKLSPRVGPAEVEPVEEVRGEPLTVDRRCSKRCALEHSDVIVRRIGGFNFQVGLKDVSARGCRVELIEEFERGEDVITRFPRLEPLGASVRWTQGTTAGIEFMRTIHPAVFHALLAHLIDGERSAA